MATYLKTTYKPVLFSCESLTKKELIQIVGRKDRAGRTFSRYWLTMLGQVSALYSGAKLQDVKFHARELAQKREEREDLELFYELATVLGAETLGKMCKFILTKGKFELSFLPIEESETEKFLAVIRKYPRYWKPIEKRLKKVLGHE